MTAIIATIPEKISYVCAAPRQFKVGCVWDLQELNEDSKITAYPAFAIDANNLKTLATAEGWAKNQNNLYDYVNKKPIILDDGPIDTVDNTPIDNIKLLSLEVRSQGGRAYKILINDKYYLDMREDVIVDVLLTEGISQGVFNGKYIWANIRGLKLVRVGSKLHGLVKDSHSKKDIPIISKKDLKVGGVYRNRRGDEAIFLGFINTYEMSPKHKLKFDYKLIKKQMLFFENKEEYLYHANGNYSLNIKPSQNYIECIREINFPKDPIEFWRNYFINKIKEEIVKYSNSKASPYASGNLSQTIEYYSSKANMVVYNEEPKKFDPSLLINFI